VLSIGLFEAICFGLFTSPGCLKRFSNWPKEPILIPKFAPKYALASFHHCFLFHSCASLNTYATYTWKTMHLVKLQHSDLPHNLGIFLIDRWVGLKLAANFPSGPRPCRLGLPSLIFWPNWRLHLV
jgi:hypothetical protein